MTREPVSRLLSLWLYWRAAKECELALWGSWGATVRKARGPLASFLEDRDVACQTDNVMARMLVWPHRLVPDTDFIRPEHDTAILTAAFAALDRFSYFDFVANPRFERNLSDWLGRAVEHEVGNVTDEVPDALREPLQRHLTLDNFATLSRRSRLDAKIWSAVVTARAPELDPALLKTQMLSHTVARHALVMAKSA